MWCWLLWADICQAEKIRSEVMVCIFVWMSIWAVHIEVAESLDSDSYINAVQRFINQRGYPSLIVSDCGTNCKGVVNELEIETWKLGHSKVGNKMAHQKIQWLFNPPSSQHIGGLWERMFWTVKEDMFAIIKDQISADFQMLTLYIIQWSGEYQEQLPLDLLEWRSWNADT